MDIWWPTDQANVSGLQPWKALVQNLSVENYTMYWQVDGDRLNAMFDSYVDWPHKEAWVDVSGWRWRESGPYTINLVAKDFAGNTIKERSVQINIIH
ncbi:MAG: hypothetical protein FJY98_04505 [Candidatus Liptonbacteria bacterium]|nr:hypothetical protein [Candidatus Liptonbacteria bacterium]